MFSQVIHDCVQSLRDYDQWPVSWTYPFPQVISTLGISRSFILRFPSLLDINTHGATVAKIFTLLYVEPRLL